MAVPAWLLSLWYIGFDVYQLLNNKEMGTVNLVAHVSGAIIGLLLSITSFRRRKQEVSSLVINRCESNRSKNIGSTQ